MSDQLALDAFAREDLCGHVCLRLRDPRIVAELSCIEPAKHAGAHRYVRVERFRYTEQVAVGEML